MLNIFEKKKFFFLNVQNIMQKECAKKILSSSFIFSSSLLSPCLEEEELNEAIWIYL